MNTNQARPVKTTLTSIKIVREIKRREGASLTEIAEALELANSTVHNHLATLSKEGFLVRQGQQYHVGLRFLQFGEYARNRRDAYKPAKIQVYRLAESTNEEVNFAIEENGFMFSIEYVMGDSNPMNPEAGSQFLKNGSRFHMHNSAPGKAILSELSSTDVERILDLRGLPATTENTLTDRDDLIEELEIIRERGYAINDEELQRGFRSIGAPVHLSDGTILGALSIGGPAYRFKVETPAINGSVNTLLDAINHVENEIAELESL
jgi:IclR family transcriptional regulator, acetate operon repressor